MSCPVCGSSAEQVREWDYGERKQFRCVRCGPFIITDTAVGMIRSRLENDPRGAARASHAIRAATTDDACYEIDSTQVDRIVSTPLPSVRRQLENLVDWMKEQVGDGGLTEVVLPDQLALTAIVGALDTESLVRLLRWADSEEIIELENQGHAARLTPRAWQPTVDEAKPKPEAPTQVESNIESGHCPQCGPDRKADVKAAYTNHYNHYDSGIWTENKYMILRCRGCEAVYVRRDYVFSEDCYNDVDAETGEPIIVCDPTTTYWPAPARRKRPEWLKTLGDQELKRLLEEVYSALDYDQRVLAAIGARTTLDRAMVLVGADESDPFPIKLEALVEKGSIGPDEKETLLALTDAGGAAAHRGWCPEPEQLTTILEGTEAFLHRTLVLGSAVQKMRAKVPPKAKRRRQKDM